MITTWQIYYTLHVSLSDGTVLYVNNVYLTIKTNSQTTNKLKTNSAYSAKKLVTQIIDLETLLEINN